MAESQIGHRCQRHYMMFFPSENLQTSVVTNRNLPQSYVT
jgi:hypothetical protein